jgi:hypothetical protein
MFNGQPSIDRDRGWPEIRWLNSLISPGQILSAFINREAMANCLLPIRAPHT